MTTRPPAEIGMSLDEVDTPALIVDLDAFERNLRRLADRVQGTGVRLRPHAKTHKCPVIALKQIELGAVGVCCQKVSEAEAMVYGGVPRRARHQRGRRPPEIAPADGAGAHRAGRGLRRRPGADRRPRSRRRRSRHRPAGACRDQHGRQPLRRRAGPSRRSTWRAASATAATCASPGCRPITARRSICAAGRSGSRRSPARSTRRALTRDLLGQHGIACDNITGAGTGTFEFEAGSGVYTELQCGSYIFMDADYGRNLDRDGAPIRAFEPSLFVWATVMSRPTDDRAIVDAGLKALAFDSGPPTVWDEPGRHLRARLRRARPPRHHQRHQPPQARRQGKARPRPLRPDRQPLRLVRRHPRRPRRRHLADHRAGGGLYQALPVYRCPTQHADLGAICGFCVAEVKKPSTARGRLNAFLIVRGLPCVASIATSSSIIASVKHGKQEFKFRDIASRF